MKKASEIFLRMRHFTLYSLIGVMGVSIDILVFFLLTSSNVHYQIANVFSTSGGILNNFFLNAFFNFKQTDKLMKRMLTFFSVGMLGLLLTAFLLMIFVDKLGFDARIVKVFSIVVVTVVQYTLNKKFSFGLVSTNDDLHNEDVKGNVAVVGGGFTGLTVAYELSKQKNIKVTVLERGEHLGGLAGITTIEGMPIEAAYHHSFLGDKQLLGLLTELGIQEKMTWRASSVGLYTDGKVYPFMGALDILRFKPLTFFNRLRTGVVSLYLQKMSWWQKLVPQTAYAWVNRWYGNQASVVIWEPLLRGKFATFYDKVSMAWLWARIHTRGKSRKNPFAPELLGYPEGSYKTIIQTILEALKKQGVEIQLRVKVTDITNDTLSIEGKQRKFDKIVLTVPSTVAVKLIKSDENNSQLSTYCENLLSIQYVSAITILFSSSQNLGKHYWVTVADNTAPFLVFINHTKLVPASEYNGKYVYYLGAYVSTEDERLTMKDEDLEKLWFNGLKKIFPNFEQESVFEKQIFRFNNAQHIVDTTYDKRIPEYQTPLENVFLANFSQIFPEDRGVNFAILEGKKVARKVLESLEKKKLVVKVLNRFTS
jgi:protoporphyrinogen oxidase